MSAPIVSYYDYDPSAQLTCPECGWVGSPGVNEYHRELFDVTCDRCDTMLLIVSYPTIEETRAAAVAGNAQAAAELPVVDRIEARAARAKQLRLERADQLPTLRGKAILIDWDFERDADDEVWTVLRRGRRRIWRELAFWEGVHRFEEVFALLHERYGERLVEVRPTRASWMYLYGDQLSAPDRVDALNAQLGGWPGG